MDSASAGDGKKKQGIWTSEEHERFMVALAKHGEGKWKAISADVKTRDSIQVRRQC